MNFNCRRVCGIKHNHLNRWSKSNDALEQPWVRTGTTCQTTFKTLNTNSTVCRPTQICAGNHMFSVTPCFDCRVCPQKQQRKKKVLVRRGTCPPLLPWSNTFLAYGAMALPFFSARDFAGLRGVERKPVEGRLAVLLVPHRGRKGKGGCETLVREDARKT